MTKRFRRAAVILFDSVAVGVALWLSFYLRFDFSVPEYCRDLILRALPWVYLAQVPIFSFFGLYKGMWAFASIPDLVLIFKAVATSTVFCVVGVYFAQASFPSWPKSIFLIDGVILFLLLGGGRFVYRYFRDFVFERRFQFSRHANPKHRVLILGAGRTGALIAKEIEARATAKSTVIGFLDDSDLFRGSRVLNKPVFGKLSKFESCLDELKPDDVIIAIPDLRGDMVKSIAVATARRQISCRIVPKINDVIGGTQHSLNQLRQITVEDLLRRDPVRIDEVEVMEFLRGKSVMVTGGGGSIGSELCRQILKYKPARLVVFDHSEYHLYLMDRELAELRGAGKLSQTDTHLVLGDVLDRALIERTFGLFRPQVVLHAAAYKHVPMIEANPGAALRNNVVGTFNVVDCAGLNQVERFVLVSTDKAVRPTSVMGASKRMAEMIVSQVGAARGIAAVAVRFGNVLDSRGSVLPLFKEQIERGGPVTVTHPDMTRYFMTIPEASSLVLQASVLGRGGEVFLLDMGEPVKIATLAEDLITLSGLRPHTDVKIEFTGLRPGEKLFEELLTDPSSAGATVHPKIWVAHDALNGRLPMDWQKQLIDFAHGIEDAHTARAIVTTWVRDYSGG